MKIDIQIDFGFPLTHSHANWVQRCPIIAIRIQRIQEVEQNNPNKLNSHESVFQGMCQLTALYYHILNQLDAGVSLGLSIQDCLLSPLILKW